MQEEEKKSEEEEPNPPVIENAAQSHQPSDADDGKDNTSLTHLDQDASSVGNIKPAKTESKVEASEVAGAVVAPAQFADLPRRIKALESEVDSLGFMRDKVNQFERIVLLS